MKKSNEFVKGYCCCLASIINSHGGSTSEKEAFECLGSKYNTAKALRDAGVDEYDIVTFKNEGYLKP